MYQRDREGSRGDLCQLFQARIGGRGRSIGPRSRILRTMLYRISFYPFSIYGEGEKHTHSSNEINVNENSYVSGAQEL